jgi:hypothetical protein
MLLAAPGGKGLCIWASCEFWKIFIDCWAAPMFSGLAVILCWKVCLIIRFEGEGCLRLGEACAAKLKASNIFYSCLKLLFSSSKSLSFSLKVEIRDPGLLDPAAALFL